MQRCCPQYLIRHNNQTDTALRLAAGLPGATSAKHFVNKLSISASVTAASIGAAAGGGYSTPAKSKKTEVLVACQLPPIMAKAAPTVKWTSGCLDKAELRPTSAVITEDRTEGSPRVRSPNAAMAAS